MNSSTLSEYRSDLQDRFLHDTLYVSESSAVAKVEQIWISLLKYLNDLAKSDSLFLPRHLLTFRRASEGNLTAHLSIDGSLPTFMGLSYSFLNIQATPRP